MKEKQIVVFGASGYIGAHLIPALLQEGYKIRAVSRKKSSLALRSWANNPNVELCEADALDYDSLVRCCQGCDIAYYLVHSMNPKTSDFESTDRVAAGNMVRAADECEIQRIIYLGGLSQSDTPLSKHLRSRIEVAEILHAGPVPVTTFKAAMIIGAGSLSFEILRFLVNRLPIMITPRWVRTQSQPIAITNVINYLVYCIDHKDTIGQTYDIGGPDIISYHELFRIYAEEAKLGPRFIIPVPVLTPKLSSYWIQFVTPIHNSVAKPLAEGLRNRLVCEDHRVQDVIPQRLIGCREAIRRALGLDGQGEQVQERRIKGDPAWVR